MNEMVFLRGLTHNACLYLAWRVFETNLQYMTRTKAMELFRACLIDLGGKPVE